MGAGDEIPTVLRQVGMDVTVISEKELASGDLGKYGTIVLGIRAYDTRDDVRLHNKRLLDFVNNGGTLVVQYNADPSEFNSGKFTPYSATLGRDRVSVEEAPVEVLIPDSPIFHWPNKIDKHDFDGWVQERGLYFPNKWDPAWTPILSCHDPNEKPNDGGLLVAKSGKGYFVYTGYSWFRELPAGVSGAYRIFANLVTLGSE
jgi:hypothetical protein